MSTKNYSKKRTEGSAPETNRVKDNSPRVPQRDKLKNTLNIRELNWTPKQKEFLEKASDPNMRVMLIEGPAGTAKTLLASYVCLQLLSTKKVSDVVYLRSAVESSDAHLGFLPGTADEKMAGYNMPFWDKMDELLPRNEVKYLIDDSRAHCMPINFIRGLSWNAKAIILDEAQNSTQKELVTTLTRLGEFSRCFILADPMQTDLGGRTGGFQKIYERFDGSESAIENGIHTFKFTHADIMRSKLVAYITKELENL